jgi:hypothetical protein
VAGREADYSLPSTAALAYTFTACCLIKLGGELYFIYDRLKFILHKLTKYVYKQDEAKLLTSICHFFLNETKPKAPSYLEQYFMT